MFLSSFAIGILNPATLLTFLFAFTYFDTSGITGAFDGIGLVSGVFLGTYIWWTALSGATRAIKKKWAAAAFVT